MSDQDRTHTPPASSKPDATPKPGDQRKDLLKDADQNKIDAVDGDEVVPDPANDWPAS
jgi:hypothetical protein